MTDIKTPDERRHNMAAIKGKDTNPEMIVRKYLFSRGLRYRLHVKNLPGTPDIVLTKYRTAIFVNGCFWHGHKFCKYFRLPKSNVEFWKRKIARNITRDARNDTELEVLGWRVIRVWECDIRSKSTRLAYLHKLYTAIFNPGIYPDLQDSAYESISLAAEPYSYSYSQDDNDI